MAENALPPSLQTPLGVGARTPGVGTHPHRVLAGKAFTPMQGTPVQGRTLGRRALGDLTNNQAVSAAKGMQTTARKAKGTRKTNRAKEGEAAVEARARQLAEEENLPAEQFAGATFEEQVRAERKERHAAMVASVKQDAAWMASAPKATLHARFVLPDDDGGGGGDGLDLGLDLDLDDLLPVDGDALLP